MNKMFLPVALFAFLLSSCCKDSNYTLLDVLLPATPAGEVACDSSLASPYVNRFTIEDKPVYMYFNTQYNGLLVADQALYWTDLNSGKLLNKIESPGAVKAFRSTRAIYSHGDLAITASSTGLAAINVHTGKLLWERALNDCDIDKGVYGVGDQYFVTRHVPDENGVVSDAVFTGNLREPERLDLLFTPAYSKLHHSWAGYGRITALAAFAGADQHTYVLLSYFETKEGTNDLDIYMALYDGTTQRWVYERQSPDDQPVTISGVHQIIVAGGSAYFHLLGKVHVWDILAGKTIKTIISPSLSSTSAGYFDSEMQINEQYMVVKGNVGDLQVWENNGHSLLYRIFPLSGDVKAAFYLDRLIVSSTDYIDVYELSSGKKLETIVAPCKRFMYGNAVWKDAYGAINLAVGAGDGNIYHYVLQN